MAQAPPPPLNTPLVQTLFALMAHTRSQDHNFWTNFRQNFPILHDKCPLNTPLPKSSSDFRHHKICTLKYHTARKNAPQNDI